tara:strand:- start:35 stop:979 length:945 start_codon:yes stop_codon:yes gene_type:complete
MSEQEMETGGEPTPQVESTIPQEQEIVEPTPQIKEVPKELTKQERITNALGDIPKEPNEQLIEAIDEKSIEKLPDSAKGVLKHLIAQQNKEYEERIKAFDDRESKLQEYQHKLKKDAKDLIQNRAQLNKMLLDPKFQQMLKQADIPDESMADPFSEEGIQQRISKGVANAMKQFQEPITQAAQRSQQMANYQNFVENHPQMENKDFKGSVRTLMEERRGSGQPISLEDAYAHVDRQRLIKAEQQRIQKERSARAKSAAQISKSTLSSNGQSKDPVPSWVTDRGYNGARGNTARIMYLRDNPDALQRLRQQQKNR